MLLAYADKFNLPIFFLRLLAYIYARPFKFSKFEREGSGGSWKCASNGASLFWSLGASYRSHPPIFTSRSGLKHIQRDLRKSARSALFAEGTEATDNLCVGTCMFRVCWTHTQIMVTWRQHPRNKSRRASDLIESGQTTVVTCGVG